MVKPIPIVAAAMLIAGLSAAQANVRIEVDKNQQRMSVIVDGTLRYQWVVSTGRANYGTPNGTYRPVRMERVWFSKQYYNSPMPHAIFFHRGYAIHGSYEISRLGGPASHGCIRLHPANAATLFAVVQREGMANTVIEVSGRNPPARVARRRAEPEGATADENEGAAGTPADVTPGNAQPYYGGPPTVAPLFSVPPGY